MVIFASHFANGSSHIQGIDFDQYYGPVEHEYSFQINIYISAMHRLTSIILDVRNFFQNMSVPIHEIVCVRLTPYYLYWF